MLIFTLSILLFAMFKDQNFIVVADLFYFSFLNKS